MKKAIKTGIEIGLVIGVARMTYSAIIAANIALCKFAEKKLTKLSKEFEAASIIYKEGHPEVFKEDTDNDEEETEDAGE